MPFSLVASAFGTGGAALNGMARDGRERVQERGRSKNATIQLVHGLESESGRGGLRWMASGATASVHRTTRRGQQSKSTVATVLYVTSS